MLHPNVGPGPLLSLALMQVMVHLIVKEERDEGIKTYTPTWTNKKGRRRGLAQRQEREGRDKTHAKTMKRGRTRKRRREVETHFGQGKRDLDESIRSLK